MNWMSRPVPMSPDQRRRFLLTGLPISTILPSVLLLWRHGGALPWLLFPIGPLLAIVAWNVPALARALSTGFAYVIHVVSVLLSAVALLLLFFGVVVPFAVVLRVVRHRAAVDLTYAPTADTYWDKPPPPTSEESVFHQY